MKATHFVPASIFAWGFLVLILSTILPQPANGQLTRKDLRRFAGVYQLKATGWIELDGEREQIKERGRERLSLNGNSQVQTVEGGSYRWEIESVRVGTRSVSGKGRIFGYIENEKSGYLEPISGSYRVSMRIIGQRKRKFRIRSVESIRFGTKGRGLIRAIGRKG